ncbi:MAG: maleylacetate reductase [Actinobacteria bacterium]|nr:maleylacetate reductase [Actinomycetota bacterium]
MVQPFTHETLPGRVLFGVGRVDEVPLEAERLGSRRILVITTPSLKNEADALRLALGERAVASWPDARPHVSRADADRARQTAREHQVDGLIALGGGSAIGLAKAVAVDDGAPMVAVPTTYSGSEMTPIYGITEGRRKKTARDERALPKTVVYDPCLTTGLPPAVTASTGMNALAHCVEALYSASPSPLSKLQAVEGASALAGGLTSAVHASEDLDARSEALYGAYLAGAVLAVTGMAIHHRIRHVLGGTFGLPHGPTNSVILPHVVRFNAPAAPEAMKSIADALDVRDAAGGLFDLARDLGAPAGLADLDMSESDLEEAAHLVADGDYYNPRPATQSDVLGLLAAAHVGRRP